jgi:hypothetical protein
MHNIELLAIITCGVFLGNILSSVYVISIPIYIWYYCWNLYDIYKFNRKYKKYFSDRSVDIFNNNIDGRNILLLCHGRSYPILHTNLINYEKDEVLTIDIDPKVNPHIISDLSKEDCFKSIPNHSIDIVIFHLCDCCTESVENNTKLAEETLRILKNDGKVWMKRKSVTPEPEWLINNFSFLQKQITDESENRPQSISYTSIINNRHNLSYVLPYTQQTDINIWKIKEPSIL